VQERQGFSRSQHRIAGFTKSTFGGPFRQLKNAAAMSLAAFFMASAPAAGTIPANQVAVAPVERGPALWVIQDIDTTIYLFGTFHALDSQTRWFDRSVRAAFNASDELVLETLVPEDPAELHSIIARHTSAREPRVGDPVISPDKAPSFVASAGQAMSAGRAQGMSVDQGADAVLRREANASGKPVEGLESFEFQLRMFASLPPPPKAAARHSANIGGFIGNMQSAWKVGDNDGFAALLGSMRTQSPLTYKTLFTDRNANWAGWIANRMAQPGTVFVAVGTGHLVGPDSVQQYLAARGIASARIS
jgi:uncharacterized protein YbaP (TraB family)